MYSVSTKLVLKQDVVLFVFLFINQLANGLSYKFCDILYCCDKSNSHLHVRIVFVCVTSSLVSFRDFLPRGSGIVTRRPLILQLVNNKAGKLYL